MAMLAQLLAGRGATSAPPSTIPRSSLPASSALTSAMSIAVVIGYLSARSVTHARYIVRRLKRVRPSLRVGVVLWAPADDPLSDLKLTAAIGCDFISRTMRDAVAAALQLRRPQRNRPRRRRSGSESRRLHALQRL